MAGHKKVSGASVADLRPTIEVARAGCWPLSGWEVPLWSWFCAVFLVLEDQTTENLLVIRNKITFKARTCTIYLKPWGMYTYTTSGWLSLVTYTPEPRMNKHKAAGLSMSVICVKANGCQVKSRVTPRWVQNPALEQEVRVCQPQFPCGIMGGASSFAGYVGLVIAA
jgi:hypothetical protein